MTDNKTHHAEHTTVISAPAPVIYGLIADVSAWPRLFPPTVHAERLSGDDRSERIQLWAFANGEVRTWTSRRALDPVARRVSFRQEAAQSPVASMSGTWSMRAGPDGQTTVVLTHDFAAEGDDPDKARWIAEAVDRNSSAELAAVKSAAEQHRDLAGLLLSFEDSVLIDGDAGAVYDFLRQCEDWPRRLDHVARLEVTEERPGIQLMEMDTRAPDGDVHTTTSVRVCLPPGRIVYRQVTVPPILTSHTGEWHVAKDGGGVRATARHTVMIKPEAVPALLGPDATVAQARQRVREALGGNSLATLRKAKACVEAP